MLVGLIFVIGFPVHTYLTQRRSLSVASAEATSLARQNRALSAEVSRLDTDAAIEQLARKDYGLVAPGEEAYALLPLPPGATPGAMAQPPRRASQAPAAPPARSLWDRILDDLAF